MRHVRYGVIGVLGVLAFATATARAGDVRVTRRVGDLRVRANDATAAQIEVVALGGGSFEVNALTSTTTINGLSSVTIENITGDVTIRGTRHDDTIRVRSAGGPTLRIRGVLSIDANLGDDLVEIESLTVEERVRVRMRRGDDTIEITNSTFGDDCEIETSGGLDSVVVTGVECRRGSCDRHGPWQRLCERRRLDIPARPDYPHSQR